ncbi:hypothetical protein niasHS_001498 [Heterodera schachtii]|uniref:poly(ADP-ribose) glycohydrolase n=1 Tax=Heterodera schachtii TaxID=97005 RepID=A0ABD2KDV1_HETSC
MLPFIPPSADDQSFASSSSSVFAGPPPLRDCATSSDFFLCRWPFSGADQRQQQFPVPKAFASANANISELFNPAIHVTLPCYDEKRWSAITTALNGIVSAGPSLTFHDFTSHVLSYAITENGGWKKTDFSALRALIDTGWYGNRLLSEILPFIAKLALELTHCIRRPIRMLLKGKNGSLTLNRHQASVLLANAFFCTFPAEFGHKGRRFPRFDFNALFHLNTHRAVEKLKFLLHYFAQIKQCPPIGTLSFIRQAVERLPNGWKSAPLNGHLTALCDGRIEDEGAAHTQMDFANEFIGGGVLGHGAVQEEIRFLICPELVVACLICERMDDNEAILLLGAERFSDYRGYCDTLRWVYRKYDDDSTKRDSMGRAIDTELLAIDALCFGGQMEFWGDQFGANAIKRELLKAYIGFSLQTPESPHGISTGNWGCGAFGGDMELKSLIQWMAACLVKPHSRPLFYFTFGNERFSAALQHLVHVLRVRCVAVGTLYHMLVEYGHEMRSNFRLRPRRQRLFRWILHQILDNDANWKG